MAQDIEKATKDFQESEEDWGVYKDHEKREMAFCAGARWALKNLP